MVRTKLFKRTFLLLFIVGSLAVTADILHLYWTTWWLDSVIHFMAGTTVGMAGVVFWNYNFKIIPTVRKSIYIGILSVLIVGILWELYELYFGIETILEGKQYYVDTISDLLQDICGGIFGALYSHRVLVKNNV